MSDPMYLTVKEVAVKLRVRPMTVYRLIHAHRLGAIQIGKSFRVPEAEYLAYVQRCTLPVSAEEG